MRGVGLIPVIAPSNYHLSFKPQDAYATLQRRTLLTNCHFAEAQEIRQFYKWGYEEASSYEAVNGLGSDGFDESAWTGGYVVYGVA
jgi:hypothetical protein